MFVLQKGKRKRTKSESQILCRCGATVVKNEWMEGEKRCRSKSVSLKPFAANLCYSLPNIRRQDSIIIYLQTIQLITKHFNSYSDVDAAKGKGQCFFTVFVQTLLQYLRFFILFNNSSQYIQSILCVDIHICRSFNWLCQQILHF